MIQAERHVGILAGVVANVSGWKVGHALLFASLGADERINVMVR